MATLKPHLAAPAFPPSALVRFPKAPQRSRYKPEKGGRLAEPGSLFGVRALRRSFASIAVSGGDSLYLVGTTRYVASPTARRKGSQLSWAPAAAPRSLPRRPQQGRKALRDDHLQLLLGALPTECIPSLETPRGPKCDSRRDFPPWVCERCVQLATGQPGLLLG